MASFALAAAFVGCAEPTPTGPAPEPRVVQTPPVEPERPARPVPSPDPAPPAATGDGETTPPRPAPAPIPPAAVDGPRLALYEAVYFDRYRPRTHGRYRLGQGGGVTSWCREHEVPTLPMVYGWAIDPNLDGRLEEQKIRTWVANAVPAGWDGPACLDYEAPYSAELASPRLTAARLAQILDVYGDLLAIARSVRPRARWGLWGLPKMNHTNDAWRQSGLSLAPLYRASGAIFPAFYDCHPDKDITGSIRRHLSRTIEDSGGERPVYAFAWCRHCGSPDKSTAFVTEEKFLADARAAASAAWADPATGSIHRLSGLVLWDAYVFNQAGDWNMLDRRHVVYLKLLGEAAGMPFRAERGTPP